MRNKSFNTVVGIAAFGALLALASISGAHAAEIKILSGNGGKAAVTELAAAFERQTGHKVSIHFEVNPGVKKRIEDGEAFDVAVLNPPTLDPLMKAGKLVADTRTVIGRAGIGAAIREGAPTPDISTV